MEEIFSVRHLTHYRYRRPVQFGEHRLMLRPHDSHDLRILATSLSIRPTPMVRYYHDPFHNSIAIAQFNEPSDELVIESLVRVSHFGISINDYTIDPFARAYPFIYDSNEFPDLMKNIERRHADPGRLVYDWARQHISAGGKSDTLELLRSINHSIRNDFYYLPREEHGPQSPQTTLQRRSGTCRDYALLMMEAVRSLGLAERFVTGYLYDPATDGADTDGADNDGSETAVVGAGTTHAWVQIYLPGAGWVEFDPTNDLIGGRHLIRVGVARDPSQAIPVYGTYAGDPDDFIDMKVEVSVTRVRKEESEQKYAGSAGHAGN